MQIQSPRESSAVIQERVNDKLGLSADAYSRILKVARTIADLDGSQNIQAVQY